jgi:hypothetical protein
MREFLVTWAIDLEAEDAMDAAAQALDMQRDPDSIANVFEVVDQATGETVKVDFMPDADGDFPTVSLIRTAREAGR